MAKATSKAQAKAQELREKIFKVQNLREKIAARKAEREDQQKQKYAKMRLVAEKAPDKLEKCLASLADKCASMAEGWENLRENLGLMKAPHNAALKLRVAAARNYAKNFKRIQSARHRQPPFANLAYLPEEARPEPGFHRFLYRSDDPAPGAVRVSGVGQGCTGASSDPATGAETRGGRTSSWGTAAPLRTTR